MSDATKARIRAEEEARFKAELEAQYRAEVRAELEAGLSRPSAGRAPERSNFEGPIEAGESCGAPTGATETSPLAGSILRQPLSPASAEPPAPTGPTGSTGPTAPDEVSSETEPSMPAVAKPREETPEAFANTDVERPRLVLPKPAPAPPAEVSPPAAGPRLPVSQRSERVRVMPVVSAPTAPPDVHDTDVDVRRRVAPALTDKVVSSAPARPRGRALMWLGLALVVLGGGAVALGVAWPEPAAAPPDAAPEGKLLRASGEPMPVGTLDDDPRPLSGERIEKRPDGSMGSTPREPLRTLDDLRRELTEPSGAPRWPIPENPPLRELLDRPPPGLPPPEPPPDPPSELHLEEAPIVPVPSPYGDPFVHVPRPN